MSLILHFFWLYWHHSVLSVKSVLFDDYSCRCLTSFCLDLLLIIMDILSDRGSSGCVWHV